MTPFQLASQECANFDAGACKRIVIRNDGSMFRSSSMPERCTMGRLRDRCLYFEDCILPMGRAGWTERRASQFEEAVKLYWSAFNQNGNKHSDRSCPGCGRPLEAKHQWCYVCVQERAKNRARSGMAKKRRASTPNVNDLAKS